MGFSDGVAAAAFQDASDGRLLFTPWGRFGPCYAVSPADRDRLVRLVQAFFLGYFLLLLLALWHLGWGVVLYGVVPAALAVFHAGMWALCRRLEAVPRPPHPGLLQRELRIARAAGRPTLWVLEILSLLFAALSLWLILAGRLLVGVPGAVFFGLCVIGLFLSLRRA